MSPNTKKITAGQFWRYVAAFSVIGVLLLALQWQGGAWSAEFDGNSDESAHFVTGQFLRQFALSLPLRDPVEWARQYYLHYPKVAIGHWPPGYLLLEAGWSLMFGRSRGSAMMLQWLLATAALSGLWYLARTFLPAAISLAVVTVGAATPVFQQGLEQTMAEPASLLCGVLFLIVMTRLLEKPGQRGMVAMLGTVFAAVILKGTGFCLAPAAFAAWLLSGKRIPRPSLRASVAIAAILAMVAAAYLSGGNPMAGSGIKFAAPWRWVSLGGLAGWGFPALAVCGISRKPVPLASTCLLGSMAATSFWVRAIAEPRHWILALPAMALLAGHAVDRFPLRTAPLALAALALFPYTRYHQYPAGYRQLFRELPLPARILVSSGRGSPGEGACVAEVNLLDKPLQSFVLRGSKVLSMSSWNGDGYQLSVGDAEDVRRRLDQLSVDRVILDTAESDDPPHQKLLKEAVEGSASWKWCSTSGRTKAYCRVRPPLYPRLPLEVYTNGQHIVEAMSGIK